MSATSASNRSNGQYFLVIEGLPKRYTWQDLKDLIRCKANHGIWTEITLWPNGQPSGKGHARVQRQDEAYKLYRWLTENVVENRNLRVHLWDISNGPAMFVQCNCGLSPQLHPPSTQIAQMALRPGWQSFYPYPSPPMAAMPPAAPMPIPQPPQQPIQSPQQQLMAAMAAMNLNPENQTHVEQFRHYYARQAQAAQMQQQQQAMQYPVYTRNAATGPPINTANGVVRVEARGIFVSGLNFKARTRDVEAYFSKVGDIVKCEVQKDPQTGKSKGNATIKYASAEAAQRALRTFDGTPFMQMTLHVRFDKDQTPITSPPAAGTSSQPARSSNEPTIVNGSAQVRQEA
ncbi:hypothetical protein M409DRAFT_20008 [Zasmidium cellare ATCC 36951]|uniref:RRM domain-containing protein n=1 Tax=Zasmidium cellare ATCC 36951 TaxID=1080233 RepID=A0A6A6CR81_ZASCE|nr:uncharacterized protein M409DRAFT_20008 [Zasmidium cellare ATCC 36951]KAF2169595.1 hypothetical protein M409DRAFT_20008 [Zasmidium cellare ATCC 36951]